MSASSSQSTDQRRGQPGGLGPEYDGRATMNRDPTMEMSEADRVRHDLKNTIFSITVQCACGRLSLEEGRLHEVRDCLARISGLAKKLSEELISQAKGNADQR